MTIFSGGASRPLCAGAPRVRGGPACAWLAVALVGALQVGPAAAQAHAVPVPAAALELARASPAARQVIQWVRASRDHQQLPFIVIDKRQARAFAFTSAGRLRGSAAVLMGAARGDHSVPGIGERPISSIRPEERTTPAGRFAAEIGRNLQGEDILWVDYGAAVSLHRVRATQPAERRLQRLASPTPEDNRISYGCINVPRAFFERVVLPLVQGAGGRAMVYVLPEVLPVTTVFPRLAQRAMPAEPPGA